MFFYERNCGFLGTRPKLDRNGIMMILMISATLSEITFDVTEKHMKRRRIYCPHPKLVNRDNDIGNFVGRLHNQTIKKRYTSYTLLQI